jgi:hypothetical protein
MIIKHQNIGILIISLTLGYLLLRHGTAVSSVLDDMQRIGPGHSADEKTVGLLALGFIGVSVVAIVRLLTSQASNDSDRRRRSRGDLED